MWQPYASWNGEGSSNVAIVRTSIVSVALTCPPTDRIRPQCPAARGRLLVFSVDEIHDDVVSHREAARDGKQIVPSTTNLRMVGQEVKSAGDRVDHRSAIAGLPLSRNGPCNFIEVVLSRRGRRCAIQPTGGCSAAKRERRRCLASSANACIDACVMIRPSPRAIEALASLRLAIISERTTSRSSQSRR